MLTIMIVLFVILIVLVAIAFRMIREQIKDHRRLEVTYDGSLEYDKMNEKIKGTWLAVVIIIILMVGMCDSAKAGQPFRRSYQKSLDAHKDAIVERMMIKTPVVVRPFVSTKGHANRYSREIRGYMVTTPDTLYVYISLRLDLDEMHDVLQHEMVHVWQVDTGELRVLRNGWVFRGNFYPIDTPYAELPHEKEAFMLESNRIFRKESIHG